MLLKQHFVNAFRMMRRRKLTSAVNIIGLAAGLASVLLLVSYVRVERSFDRYHKKSDRLYILTNEFREEFYGGSHHFLAGMLASRFPEVRTTARFDVLRLPLKTGGDPFFQQVAMVDPGLFSLLDFPVRSGDPTRDLVPPRQAFLSSEAAGRLFSEGDPRGKTLSIRLADGFRDYVVAGVFRDFPGNSSLRFDVAVNFENFFPAIGLDRNSTDFVFLPLSAVTFLEIPTPDEARLLLSKLPAFHLEIYKKMWDSLKMAYPKAGFGLLPFEDYHLGDVRILPFEPRSRRASTWILLAVSGLILLLAGFNYVNLSLAQAVTRIKDFGVRRIVGAKRGQLVVQHLFQTCLEVFLAMAAAIGLALLWLKPFNALTGKRLSAADWGSLTGGGLVLALSLATGLAAGIVPSLVLSAARAPEVLRGRTSTGGRRRLSWILVFAQCAVSIVFLAGTLVMMRQLAFIQGRDLGYDPRNVIQIRTQLDLGSGDESRRLLDLFRAEILRDPRVTAVTGDVGSLIGGFGGIERRLEKDGRTIEVHSYFVSSDYLQALKVPLVAGRNFSPEFPSDVRDAALVNETFVRTFGLKDAVGHRFSDFSRDVNPKGLEYDPVIIGVFKDFQQTSLRHPVEPVALDLHGFERFDFFRNLLIRLSGNDIPGALKLVETTWRGLKPEQPFIFSFLEDDLAGQYGEERSWSRIVGFSTGLAFLVAGMGMFALAALAAVRRTKEIGIRKVLGARTAQVTGDLVREFAVLWGAANVAGWPVAYWLGRAWLRRFAAQAALSPWLFVLVAGGGGLLILMPVALRARRAALSDPVACLRYE
jgi:putative ABC transport system permease protein